MNDAAARAEMARAVHARRSGDLAGAAAIASAVLARRPDDAGALNLLGLLAQSAGRLDEAVDRLRRASFRELLGSEWTYGVEPAVDIALLGRYYERIADHAVSIARRVVYLVTGEHPAHQQQA